MKHRERQKRAWRKIDYMKKSRRMGPVDRLGISSGFENATRQEIWGFLQEQPSMNSWNFITNQELIKK